MIDDRDSDGVMDNEKEFILPEDMPTAFFCNSDLAASMMYQKLVRKGTMTGDIPLLVLIIIWQTSLPVSDLLPMR